MGAIQSEVEEKYNTLTHGLGVVLSFIGFILLVINHNPTAVSLGAIIVYGFGLLFLFSASTAYHFIKNNKYKKLLRKVDHISIYFLIAGTYTPICLSILKNSQGELILYLVWGITFVGLLLKLFFTGKFEKISLLLYLVMGWLIVLDMQTLYQSITNYELACLVLGGFSFTIGVLFYIWHKLKYHHVIWHIFVLLGAFFHYLMIYSILN